MLGRDELVCGGIPLADFTTVVDALRAGLGESAVLYANECAPGIAAMAAAGGVPANLSLISIDMYDGKNRNGTQEVVDVKNYLTTTLFPLLAARTKVMLVPGIFASDPVHCEAAKVDCPLAAQEEQIVKKLDLFWSWAKVEKRIRGFNG